jgi:hypothetical protein
LEARPGYPGYQTAVMATGPLQFHLGNTPLLSSVRRRETVLQMEPPEADGMMFDGMTSTPVVRDRSSALNQSVSRKASTICLGAFNGTSIPLETHLAKLNNCSIHYGWSAADRVFHLKASLEGAAATLLW